MNSSKGYKIIHTSDWHLGAPIDWGNEKKEGLWINFFRRYKEKAIENVVEEAIKNRVMAVLVSGDVVDIYSYYHIKNHIHRFLESKVVIPLSKQGIKLFLTLGAHDNKSAESAFLLMSLKENFENDVELLIPKEFKSLFKHKAIHDSAVCNGLTISCHQPTITCEWIQFRHNYRQAHFSHKNPPMYRAFGDKHVITFKKNRSYFPGAPFARSSASDNQFTDVGPRYCLLYQIDKHTPTPIRLKVPEIAVASKALYEKNWKIFYDRDYRRDAWIAEPDFTEPIKDVLERIIHEKPDISFVTFVLDAKEQANCSNALYRELLDFLGEEQKVVAGSRRGIITVNVKEFLE